MLAERITSPSTDRTELTPVPTHTSDLFVLPKSAHSFGIRPVTLFHPNRVGTPHPHRFLYPVFSWPYKSLSQQPLSFHIYTKRGACEADFRSKWKSAKPVSSADNEKSTARY